MKNFLYVILAVILFTSCNKFSAVSDFSVSLDPENTYEVNKTITFNFDGNPNYLTFYSGELGNNYKLLDRSMVDPEGLQAFIQFKVKVEDAAPDNTLKLMISDNFTGLTTKNYKADSTAIFDSEWTDLSTAAQFPIAQNGEANVNLDISQYLTKPTSIAFKYVAVPNATKKQPKWTISNLHILLESPNGDQVESLDSTRRGFVPFDFLDKITPYTNRTTEGRWNVSFPQTTMVLASTAAGLTKPSNLDWVISKPTILNQTSRDLGIVVKSMQERKTSFGYKFSKAGDYEVVFVAKNSNFENESVVVKRLTVSIK
ncbi:DUF5017 domain-containing protein [Pedobacter nyackensis]|uniref:DUF5017 domain-containing protein n=1 Tax=Pedobacter nyackensis TaxID=475255 RepID=A0A1W2D164_9SPHI|nr:DUF5017 domain-containing protein [Pedobacter nyackensis]SMC91213.1 protein of unknown function [Pedobacter nyackensis]